jgi:hypothetical protein
MAMRRAFGSKSTIRRGACSSYMYEGLASPTAKAPPASANHRPYHSIPRRKFTSKNSSSLRSAMKT